MRDLTVAAAVSPGARPALTCAVGPGVRPACTCAVGPGARPACTCRSRPHLRSGPRYEARPCAQEPPSPVGDAVAPIVAQGVVLGALPGDGGLGAATNSTSKNNGLPCLTCDFAQGNDEFWGNCRRKESVSRAPGSPPCPPRRHAGGPRSPPHPELRQKPLLRASPACPGTRTLPPRRPRPVRPEGRRRHSPS